MVRHSKITSLQATSLQRLLLDRHSVISHVYAGLHSPLFTIGYLDEGAFPSQAYLYVGGWSDYLPTGCTSLYC